MADNNPIYEFLKANKLTDLDEKSFLKTYSDKNKAKEIYDFFKANSLTEIEFDPFYSAYLKKKDAGVSNIGDALSAGAKAGVSKAQSPALVESSGLVPTGTETQTDIDAATRWNQVQNPSISFTNTDADPVKAAKESAFNQSDLLRQYTSQKPASASSTATRQPVSARVPAKRATAIANIQKFDQAQKAIQEAEGAYRYNINNSLAHLMGVTGVTSPDAFKSMDDDQLEKIVRPNNETDRLAIEAVKDARNVRKAMESGKTLEEVAIFYAGQSDPQVARQIEISATKGQVSDIGSILSGQEGRQAISSIGMFSEATLGKHIYNLVTNPVAAQELQSDPDLKKQFKEAIPVLINRYPDFGKTYLGNVISQKMEEMGINNSIFNVPTKAETDKVVERLQEEGVFGPQEVRFYYDNLRESGIKMLGRKIMGREYIDTPGAIESTLAAGVKGIKDFGTGAAELTGARKLLVGEQTMIARDMAERDNEVMVRPTSIWREISQSGGQFLGQSLTIGAGGKLLTAGKIMKNANATAAVAGGLQAYANYIPVARSLFPGDELKQRGFATIMAGVEMATENIFKDRKVIEGIASKMKPAVRETIQQFTQNKIDSEAARAVITSAFRKAFKATPAATKFFAKAVKENTAEEVIAQAGQQITTGVFTGKPLADYLNGEELLETAKQASLGSLFIGGMAARADMMRSRGITAKHIYEMAHYPEYWKAKIQEAAQEDPDIAADAPDKIANLEYAAKVLQEIAPSKLTEKQKIKYLITSLESRVKRAEAANIVDPVLKKKATEEVKAIEAAQEEIISGKDDGTIDGDKSEVEVKVENVPAKKQQDADIETKKADIEKRREEELKARVVYDRFPTAEDGEFKIIGDPNNRIFRINETTGRPQVLDEANGLWSNTEEPPKMFMEITKRSGFQKSKDKINSKYDAELSELNKTESSKKEQHSQVEETPSPAIQAALLDADIEALESELADLEMMAQDPEQVDDQLIADIAIGKQQLEELYAAKQQMGLSEPGEPGEDDTPDADQELQTEPSVPAETQETAPVNEWTTPSGTHIVRIENGKRKLFKLTGKGKKRTEVEVPEYIIKEEAVKSGKQRGLVKTVRRANPEYNRVMLEHAKSMNYNTGKTSEQVGAEPPQFDNEDQAWEWQVSISENPAEIAALWLQIPRRQQEFSAKDEAIQEAFGNVGRISRKSFVRHGDPNIINADMAQTYFGKKEERGKLAGIDQVALAASDYGDGLDVSTDDVVDFMIRFPRGLDSEKMEKTNAHHAAEVRFQELTGVSLDPGNGRLTVAHTAAKQYTDANKLTEVEDRLEGPLPFDYFVGVAGPILDDEINSQSNTTDYAKETQAGDDPATDRTDTGIEGETGQTPAGETGGSDRGDSGYGSSGRSPWADTGAAEGGEQYTPDDFERELNELLAENDDNPADDEFFDDDVPFMAAGQNYDPATKEAFDKVKTAIEATFQGTGVLNSVKVLTGQDFQDAVNEVVPEEQMAKSDGTIYGFIHKGVMVLNGDVLNTNTPIHEASHLFTKWAKTNAPELYSAGQKLAADSDMVKWVKKQPFYQEQARRMEEAGRSQDDIEAMFRDEALAFAVGNKGAKIASESKRASFRQWLKKLWTAVKDLFTGVRGIEKMSAEQMADMTFDDLAAKMAERILSGKQLQGQAQADGDAEFMAKQKPQPLVTPTGERIAKATQKALAFMPEQAVRSALKKVGYSDLLIENIIQNAKRMPKYRPLKVPNTGTGVALTPTNVPKANIKVDSPFDSFKKQLKKFKAKYFSVNKGMPEFVLPIAEKTSGIKDKTIQDAYRVVKQLKDAAKKEGFTDWDAVDNVLRSLKNPNGTIQQTTLSSLPTTIQPLVVRMRTMIDSMSKDLIVNGYVTPEQALIIEKNIGEYMTRAYKAYNEKSWARKVKKDVKVIDAAFRFLYHKQYATIKAADPTIPNTDAEKQAEDMANKRLKEILEGIDSEYGPQKISTIKGRDNKILNRREDIPKPIRDLLGEYIDPGEAFMMTIAKMATLKSQAQFLSSVRDLGMGTMFWEENDPNRPQDASVQFRSEESKVWNPLSGLYTTPEIKEFFDASERTRNSLVSLWLKAVAAVRWGKTVGSIVTQVKNFLSNFGFVTMNGHFRLDKSGESWAYLWDQAKWWNGDMMESEVIDDAAKQGLIGQNVGVRELKNMFNNSNTRNIVLAAATGTDTRSFFQKTGGGVFRYANKLYSASDDFFKIYGFVNERITLAKARYGVKYNDLTAEQKNAVDNEAAERVKNTYPTYDRVWEGAKYLSKNAPIFGNFLAFQAESVRTMMNTVIYAVSDMKDPNMRAAGIQRAAGIMAYFGARYMILHTIAQLTGVGMAALVGGGGDEEDKKKKAIDRFVLPFMRSSEKFVLDKGSGKYTVYDLLSLEPYNIWFKTINAYKTGTENNVDPGALSSVAEFFGPFGEQEMTFETMMQILDNDDGRGQKIYKSDQSVIENAAASAGFVWKKLQPSTVGFVGRFFTGDPEDNLSALVGARPYELDIAKSFNIKMAKYSERAVEINKDYFKAINTAKTATEAMKAGEEADTRMSNLRELINEDKEAAIYLGVDPAVIENKMESMERMMIRPWNRGTLTEDELPPTYEERAKKTIKDKKLQ